MSVTDLPVRVVDDFVPTETAYIVIRYNRNATQIKNREGQPEASTRVHVVCTLLRGKAKKGAPSTQKTKCQAESKKGCTDQMEVFCFLYGVGMKELSK